MGEFEQLTETTTEIMKTLNYLLPMLLLNVPFGCSAQVNHAITTTVKIDGDCGMCETTIEKVGSVKGESEVDWDVDTHMARVTFDSTRTNLDAILQRVAQAGYDNERYLAPKEAYSKLPGCCQYERSLVHAPVKNVELQISAGGDAHQHGDAEDHAGHGEMAMVQDTAVDHLKPVFDAYFKLKDALVASDGNKAKQAASAFDDSVHGVPMEKLDHTVHMVWMKVMEQLMEPTHMMAKTTDIEAQRKQFAILTAPLLELAKAAPQGTIYVDHCPMYEGGADWLSLEKPIKNPFYGSMMLSCGSVKETLVK